MKDFQIIDLNEIGIRENIPNELIVLRKENKEMKQAIIAIAIFSIVCIILYNKSKTDDDDE